MKRLGLILLTLGFFSNPLVADTATIPVPPPPHHTILVWAMGPSSPDVAAVELDVLEALAKHGTQGERLSKFLPEGCPSPAKEAITQMRTSKCDLLLVLRKRATVDWKTPSKAHAYSSLEAFLNHCPVFAKPKNQTEKDANVPIQVPNAYGNTMMEIVKGEMVVFDLTTEKDILHGDTQIKSAKDLPQSQYYKLVAEKVATDLAAAGLIPAKK